MNIFKKIYNNVYHTIAPEVTRFPLIVFTSIIASVFFSVSIFVKDEVTKIFYKINYSVGLTLALSIFLAFLFEYILDKKLQDKKTRIKSLIIQFCILLASYVLSFVFCLQKNPFYKLGYFGLIFVFLILTAFCLIKFYQEHEFYFNINFAALYSSVLSSCFLAGVCLLIWAISSLLFHIDEKWYGVALIFTWVCVFINYFIANIITPSEKTKEHIIYKVVVKNVMFTLYIILLAVLYLFLIKSLITFKMPIGQINWFVSFATAYYFVFYIALKFYKDEKYILFFYKYGFLILIPLVILQIVVYFIRVSEFGFTVARYASLLYIIFSIIGIFICNFKSAKFFKYIFIIFASFIFVATLGPLNIKRVPLKNQINRIENIYKKYNLFAKEDLNNPDAKLIIPKEEQQKIYDSFVYLKGETEKKFENHKILPLWYKKYLSKYRYNWKENFIFCFGYNIDDDITNDIYFSATAKSFDVENYSKLTIISESWVESDKRIIVRDLEEYVFDITEPINDFFKNNKPNQENTIEKKDLLIFELPNKQKFYITRCDGKFLPDGTLKDVTIRGYIAIP